jgi:hypothetical protein
MITVAPHAEENISSKTVFDTKGLAVIWGKFPEYYSAKNTIHVRPTLLSPSPTTSSPF